MVYIRKGGKAMETHAMQRPIVYKTQPMASEAGAGGSEDKQIGFRAQETPSSLTRSAQR